MNLIKRSIIYLLLCCLLQAISVGIAAEYPNRPIEFVIPFNPGTSSDLIGRRIAEITQKYLGVKFIINNKPGGTGANGYAYIHSSKPDGYTIGIGTSTLVAHKIFGNSPIDHNDVEVVILNDSEPRVLCVPANSKYQSLEEIIDDAKRIPGKITWGTSSGTLLTASGDFFRAAGIEVKVIPSGGGGVQSTLQASGGHVDMSFTGLVEAKAQIEANLLRPIAFYSHTRSDIYPDVPTFMEYGYPVRFLHVRGIITPPGVEKDKLEILNDAFKKAVDSEEFKEFCSKNSSEILGVSFEDARRVLDDLEAAFKEMRLEMQNTAK